MGLPSSDMQGYRRGLIRIKSISGCVALRNVHVAEISAAFATPAAGNGAGQTGLQIFAPSYVRVFLGFCQAGIARDATATDCALRVATLQCSNRATLWRPCSRGIVRTAACLRLQLGGLGHGPSLRLTAVLHWREAAR